MSLWGSKQNFWLHHCKQEFYKNPHKTLDIVLKNPAYKWAVQYTKEGRDGIVPPPPDLKLGLVVNFWILKLPLPFLPQVSIQREENTQIKLSWCTAANGSGDFNRNRKNIQLVKKEIVLNRIKEENLETLIIDKSQEKLQKRSIIIVGYLQ